MSTRKVLRILRRNRPENEPENSFYARKRREIWQKLILRVAAGMPDPKIVEFPQEDEPAKRAIGDTR